MHAKLPDYVRPEHYRLELAPDFSAGTFRGEETIDLLLSRSSDTITLNAVDLEIISAELLVPGQIAPKSISVNQKQQTVSFRFPKPIPAGAASLHIVFQGKLREDLCGFYLSTYKTKRGTKSIATTQFEPADARKAFPCFDQPNLKAKFSVILDVPKDMVAISNMPVRKEKKTGERKRVWFQETPRCPTYLLAFIVGRFDYVQAKTANGTIVRVYTAPGKKQLGAFALETGKRVLEFYNHYFQIPYPLPKLDMIAIPDFNSGAMENWGAVTYRETALLIDPKQSSAATRQRVALVVAHELAHQWFGNLVTMKWWNDLWLNEGFASWMEYKPVAHLFPEWDIWSQFVSHDTKQAMSLDGLESSHPIEVPVQNPDELGEIFDAVSYSKGASIIRMLEQFLGEDVFRKGITEYLKKHSYGNAETADLWAALAEASGKPVPQIMNTWTKQTGYPVVRAAQTGKKIQLTQQRFLFSGKKDQTRWKIPVGILNNGAVLYHLLDQKTKVVPRPDGSIVLNPDMIGFYLPAYDQTLLNQLIPQISQLKPLDRLSVESTLYALAKGGYEPLAPFLDALTSYKNETSYFVWSDLIPNMLELRYHFFARPWRTRLDAAFRETIASVVRDVGWTERKNEPQPRIFLRSMALAAAGFLGDQGVLEEASRQFKIYLRTGKLNPNLRAVVYSLASFSGGEAVYEELLRLYRKETLQEEKIRLLAALCASADRKLVQRTLEFSLSEEVRSQDTPIVLARTAGNPIAKGLAWAFYQKHWKEFKKRYSGGTHTPAMIVSVVASGFSAKEQEAAVKRFFQQNDAAPNAKRAVAQALEAIRTNTAFVSRNERLLARWPG